MARDPLETRGYQPLIPEDLNDPPRFGQPSETVKDAVLTTIRRYLTQENALPTVRTAELPTFQKYALGYGPGTNPYETFTTLVQEYPDVLERLPHVAVTSASGSNNRPGVGAPILGPTWYPPRVQSTTEGPYAFANPQRQVSTITVDAAVFPFTYTATIQGRLVSYPSTASDTTATIAVGLTTAILDAARLVLDASSAGNVSTLTWLEPGVSFSLAVSANLTAATPTPASVVTQPNVLSYRTKPWLPGQVPQFVDSEIVFAPSRFATGTITAATAADVARIINEQARYASAAPTTVGAGTGIRLLAGGPLGGMGGPNEIEILDNGTDIAATLGLAFIDTGAGGDTIVAGATSATATIAGALFTAAMVGSYVTITGAPTAANNGRFLITTVPGPTQVTYATTTAVSESAAGVRFFVGQRDTSLNIARPAQNRYVQSLKYTVNVSVLTESANTRTELIDLIVTQWTFWLELQYFQIFGRGVFDETYASEQYQVIVHQEIMHAGDADYPRPGSDNKDKIYEGRLQIPVTILWYLDRQVTVPSGPEAGQSWVEDASDVTIDDSIPSSS